MKTEDEINEKIEELEKKYRPIAGQLGQYQIMTKYVKALKWVIEWNDDDLVV